VRSKSIVLVVIGSLVASVLSVSVAATVSPAPAPAQAADSRLFDPGNIISDAMFFDGGAMSAAEVQAFLSNKVPTCRAGYTCLKSFTQAVPSKAAVDGRCAAYVSQGTESAATIIAKVGSACGISQKALLVLLEKEQSLVTDTWPESGQYRSATGYGCPDTAACDANYYGFFNQVYNAALQFKRYAATPLSWNHIAGRVNNIRLNPTASCGTSAVFIQNQATAGLYNYTPYVPNAAALANLYGTGDGCSSYGNRNFWRIFTDWFGSTTGPSSLLRTATNGTVYVVAGTMKYPIADINLLTALSPLGAVGYVSQSYLDEFTTGPIAGRILRGTDGSIYFFDSGLKLPFPSCGLVADYGGSCAATGYMQLTDAQLAAFKTGPLMTTVLGTTVGARYYVTNGTKREILDNASQAAAGLPLGYNVLTESALASMPLGSPVIRDQAFVQQRSATSYSFLSSGRSYPVPPSAASIVGLPSRVSGTLSAASIAQIPAAGAQFAGAVTVPGSGVTSVLSSTGRYSWTGGFAAPAAVPVTQATLDTYPSLGTITTGSFVKGSGGTVYVVGPTDLKPVSSWDALLTLVPKGAGIGIATLSDQVVSALPTGQIVLGAGRMVRSPSDATVYLVNGLVEKIPLTSFDISSSIGATQLDFVSDAVLTGYPKASATLGYGVTCGSTSYVGASGTLRAVDATTKPLYPVVYTSLDSFTCATLSVGAPATSFIRTPDGSIYQLVGGQKRPISSLDRLVQLGGSVGWVSVTPGFAANIPTGALA